MGHCMITAKVFGLTMAGLGSRKQVIKCVHKEKGWGCSEGGSEGV